MRGLPYMQNLEQCVYILVISSFVTHLQFLMGEKNASIPLPSTAVRMQVQGATWKHRVPLEQCFPKHLQALGYLSEWAPQIIQNESEVTQTTLKSQTELASKTFSCANIKIVNDYWKIRRTNKIKDLYRLLKVQLWAVPQAPGLQSNSRQGGRLGCTPCSCCSVLHCSLPQTPELDWPLVLVISPVLLCFTPQQVKK